MGEGNGCLRDDSGLADVEGPEPAAFGFRDVERLLVGREADPVRGQHRMRDLDDMRPVGFRVIDGALVAVAMARLAEIGEIESAVAIKHDVVRPLELDVAAAIVEHAELAGLGVDALDAAAAIAFGRADRTQQARLLAPFEAAVVADIERAVRPDREAVGAAPDISDDAHRPVRRDAGDGSARDFDQRDGAVFQSDRTFGKAQSGRQNFHVVHVVSSPYVCFHQR